MIYDLRAKICFVHIPRTAGMAITASLARTLPEAAIDTLMNRHIFGWQLRDLLGAAWDRAFRFAVIRNPWDLIASDWRLTVQSLGDLANDWITPCWRARLERAKANPDFRRFVAEEYLDRWSGLRIGGFWRTWCCDLDGGGLGIDVQRYETLTDWWPDVARRLGLPDLPLPRVNGTTPQVAPWTSRLIDAIGVLCSEDIDLFGYQFSQFTE